MQTIKERRVNSNEKEEREFNKTTRNSTKHTRKEIGPKYNASNVTNSVTLITCPQLEKIQAALVEVKYEKDENLAF